MLWQSNRRANLWRFIATPVLIPSNIENGAGYFTLTNASKMVINTSFTHTNN